LRYGDWRFKPNTDDMREAPSVVIINELLKHGATVSAHDRLPLNQQSFICKTGSLTRIVNMKLLRMQTLYDFYRVNEFRNPDFSVLTSKLKNKVIFDGRNIFEPSRMKELNYTYYSIGRSTVKN